MAEALELITQVRARFRSAYARMLDQVLQRRLPLAVCTIYEARFPDRSPAAWPPPHSPRSMMPSRAKLSPAASIASIFASFATMTATSQIPSNPPSMAAQRSQPPFYA
jgi:hypothetical protein